ncbi:MAG: hypothetical protein LCH51_01960 [Bacteroidetes bacterium]|nr:hypothetical protein [Bacteroidota bacterium]
MRFLFLLLLTSSSYLLHAQELYVFSEPASNIPAYSATAKLTARYTRSAEGRNFQRYNPEWMMGLSKTVMLKTSLSFSNVYADRFRWESAKVYAKWRFLSNDGIHRHFRMAAFADLAYSRNKDMYYDEMNLDGDNSGAQIGLVATQLLGKLAVSGTASVMQFMGTTMNHGIDTHDYNNLSYSLSAGYLLFPRQYANYNQTNLNLYVEALGAKGFQQGRYFVDIAPAIQLIFASKTKLNLGLRHQLTGNMFRIADNNYYISLETSFLNILKRNKHKSSTDSL